MKPYGLQVIDGPDVADIKEMGAKGSTGKFAGHSGDYHPYSRGAVKARARRYWKRIARREEVQEIEEQLAE